MLAPSAPPHPSHPLRAKRRSFLLLAFIFRVVVDVVVGFTLLFNFRHCLRGVNDSPPRTAFQFLYFFVSFRLVSIQRNKNNDPFYMNTKTEKKRHDHFPLANELRSRFQRRRRRRQAINGRGDLFLFARREFQ